MRADLRFSSLIPSGLRIDHTAEADGEILVMAVQRHAALVAFCARSRHSACTAATSVTGRTCPVPVAASCILPHGGSTATSRAVAGTSSASVSRTTYSLMRARRPAPLEGIIHHLGLALGCRPGVSFAKRLMMRVLHDTLLRVV